MAAEAPLVNNPPGCDLPIAAETSRTHRERVKRRVNYKYIDRHNIDQVNSGPPLRGSPAWRALRPVFVFIDAQPLKGWLISENLRRRQSDALIRKYKPGILCETRVFQQPAGNHP